MGGGLSPTPRGPWRVGPASRKPGPPPAPSSHQLRAGGHVGFRGPVSVRVLAKGWVVPVRASEGRTPGPAGHTDAHLAAGSVGACAVFPAGRPAMLRHGRGPEARLCGGGSSGRPRETTVPRMPARLTPSAGADPPGEGLLGGARGASGAHRAGHGSPGPPPWTRVPGTSRGRATSRPPRLVSITPPAWRATRTSSPARLSGSVVTGKGRVSAARGHGHGNAAVHPG